MLVTALIFILHIVLTEAWCRISYSVPRIDSYSHEVGTQADLKWFAWLMYPPFTVASVLVYACDLYAVRPSGGALVIVQYMICTYHMRQRRRLVVKL